MINKSKTINNSSLYLEKFIFFIGIFFTTTSMAPWWISDGFNVPKFFFLIILGLTLMPYILVNLRRVKTLKNHKFLIPVLVIFPITLTLVLLANNANKVLQFYGEVGRRSGYLTYLSCFLILVYTAISKINSIFRDTLNLLFVLGIISAIYSLIQPLGIIKIYQLNSQNTKPYSFFGNTNFNSGFLGIVSILIISKIFFKPNSFKNRAIDFSLLFLFEIAIFRSESQQGFVISFSGLICICLLWVYRKFKNKKAFKISVIISLFLAIQFILATVNKGLIKSLIWGPSVEARNYYWKAAVQMTNSNPILGVGLDRYGDWYWAYRDKANIDALGPQDFSTSAHNIFLDISSSGGYLLLLSYLILIFGIFIAGLHAVKRDSSWELSAVFVMWIGFNVYCLISIGQIGVLVWGWILGGLILNWYAEQYLIIDEKWKKYPSNGKVLVFFFVSVIVAAPVVKESFQIRNAISLNNPQAFESYVESNFIEPNNIAFAIIKLNEFGSIQKSVFFLRKAITRYPDNYKLWETLYTHPMSSIEEKTKAYQNLLRLNFYNKILAELNQ